MPGNPSQIQDESVSGRTARVTARPNLASSPLQTSSSDEHDSSRESLSASPITPKRSSFRGLRPGLGSRTSSTTSLLKLNNLLPRQEDHGSDTYGVREVRDGFFDAVFLKAPRLPSDEGLEALRATLPAAFDQHNPLTIRHFLPNQWRELKSVVQLVFKTQAGIKLLRVFLAYFIAYVLCLVPAIRHWLGRQHYIMAVSVILNHPARTVGAQVDGVAFSVLGTAVGIAWGVLGLLLSTSTLTASAGYGGVLALFLLLFISGLAWIRAFFVRFYQAVLTAGIAIIHTTLSDTHNTMIPWPKLRSYAVSFLLGQAIALAVNVLIWPDAGARPLALTLHRAFQLMQEALKKPQSRDVRLRRQLSKSFVDLSEAYRDMAIDTTISRFQPRDVIELRNLMQAVLRALLSMDTESTLLDEPGNGSTDDSETKQERGDNDGNGDADDVMGVLATPTKDLVVCMREGVLRCNAALMDLSGHRKSIGPSRDASSDTMAWEAQLKQTIADFDTVESSLLHCCSLPDSALYDSEIAQLFVFAQHVREAASAVQLLLHHVSAMRGAPRRPHFQLPSYPLSKAIYRTNAQIRHDRGGVVAGSYDVTFGDIARLLDAIKSRAHEPAGRTPSGAGVDDAQLRPETSNTSGTEPLANDGKQRDGAGAGSGRSSKVRYRIWRGLYRLQGSESKYVLKACLVTSLLAVPSYLDHSKRWWDRYATWWAVAMSWVVMHPRVGGNLQDLLNRSCLAILGASWAGAAHVAAAGSSNPFVIAAFAAVYMLPMLYRYALSSHPRSGLVGSLSFTVVSLTLFDDATTADAARRGLAFFVGTAAPMLVNWALWPFVARHELRAALSAMLFFLSVTYRSALATYVDFDDLRPPWTAADVRRSERLEGRLREGFVRVRQLLVLTRHEPRLRARLDPLPWSALAEACERFFDHLIAARQAALRHSNGSRGEGGGIEAALLLPLRRDAVAAVLATLYVLAGALRARRRVPRYLPSAAAARKALLVRSDAAEEEAATAAATYKVDDAAHRKWSDIYRFSYNQSLTGCVVQLEEMERYTKLIVGEQGFDDQSTM